MRTAPHVTHSRRRPDVEEHFRAVFVCNVEVWQDDQERDEFLVVGKDAEFLARCVEEEFPREWRIVEYFDGQLVLHRPRAFLVE